MSEFNVVELVIKILALLVAIIGHEIMHGLIALKYGDDTAKLEGRLTINPIKHIDLLGSILLPLVLFAFNAPFLFGWAKPVPVDIREVIRNGGYNGAIFVSLAGIFYNLILAVIAALLVRTMSADSVFLSLLAYFLLYLVIYNIVLAVFNLLPIPPLDGSQALGYLSLKFNSDKIPLFFNRIERFGIIILMLLLFIPPFAILIATPIKFLINMLLGG